MTTPLAEDALRRVGFRPGMRFLDVAAGSGALSIPAARLGARVLATDVGRSTRSGARLLLLGRGNDGQGAVSSLPAGTVRE